MYHIGLQVLRAKIRGFIAAGSTISSRISKAEKQRKHRLWDAKRNLGTHCRHHLIAYGLLRCVPYHLIERCAPNNRPNPQAVLDIMLAHADWQEKKGLDLERVKVLLSMSNLATSTVPCVDATPASRKPMTPEPFLLPTKPLVTARRPLEKRT